MWKYRVLLLLVIPFVISCERFETKVTKTIAKYTGGEFTVKIYNGGQLIATYKGEGYVWFERDENDKGRHSGVVSFKTEDGKFVRVGSWGGVIIVEYK
ncbi:MAG: hypothetical protein GXO22_07200 [Aquificae bacterium]|nr:hypothetical protein [Aquificota bacterium]